MGLINQKTDLKSLKFGNDRVYGGNSKQPYIQTPIPEKVGEFGFLNEDFILRGGSKAVTDSALDVVRLGKYFTDIRNPSGLLFIAKQNLLSRTAVRTQASTGILNEGVYTPLSTLAQAAGVAFGLHVNKQGLNPFNGPGSLTTYTDAINPILGETFSIINKDRNRLTSLYDNILVNNTGPNNFGFKRGITLNDGNNVLSYQGGPGSILGIGRTNIRFATSNVGSPLRTIYDTKETNLLSQNGVITYTNKQISNIPKNPSNGESFLIGFPSALAVGSTTSNYGNSSSPGDFRKLLRNNPQNIQVAKAPNYTEYNIQRRNKLGDPGGNQALLDRTNYTTGISGFGNSGTNSYDRLNVVPIYQSEGPALTTEKPVNDLVKFRIGVINNDNPDLKKYIHFRAFLDQISDNFSADWSATKYIGRGENFYTYNGFDRKVSLSWTVAAQSKIELIPMYRKLNYLASVCAPDYSSKGYMRGNIVTLTIGGYFYEQPGIITGFNYSMNDDNATWEIGINAEDEVGNDPLVKELPHLIKVEGFNFIPIHTFVPRLQELKIVNKEVTAYGKERYIALSNGIKEYVNYDYKITYPYE